MTVRAAPSSCSPACLQHTHRPVIHVPDRFRPSDLFPHTPQRQSGPAQAENHMLKISPRTASLTASPPAPALALGRTMCDVGDLRAALRKGAALAGRDGTCLARGGSRGGRARPRGIGPGQVRLCGEACGERALAASGRRSHGKCVSLVMCLHDAQVHMSCCLEEILYSYFDCAAQAQVRPLRAGLRRAQRAKNRCFGAQGRQIEGI